jgi:hypothetical protein
MNVSKYAVFATILLLSLSSTASIVTATSSPFLCTSDTVASTCTAVQTHGPLVGAVVFSIVGTDSALKNDLKTGTIQGAEWTLTTASYKSLTGTSAVAEGATGTYTFDGIAFNTLKPYINNVYFRQAIAYLVSYSYITTDVLSGGLAGVASPNTMPCTQYPSACYAGTNPYALNTQVNAYKDLMKAGLHPNPSCGVTPTAKCLKTIKNWYVGPGDKAGGLTCTKTSTLSKCIFSPLFYYRNDDPLRMGAATNLCSVTAPAIGFHINCKGIPDSSAGADVYTPAFTAYTAGTYNPATGYNSAPKANAVFVNGTKTKTSQDAWSMYTFGWITSAYYTWPWYFYNSAGPDNFVGFYNKGIDYYTNNLLFATKLSSPCTSAVNSCGAEQAATKAAGLLISALPYVGFFYENQLYAVYQTGWTGYANLPSTGPGTSTGLYYTLLNVHPTSSTYSPTSTFKLGLHSVADVGGMNPLYATEWVWQADIWGSIYDAPLAAPPTQLTTPNVFLNWMTTSYSVAPFTGSTGTGAGWFQFLAPGLFKPAPQVANTIKNGEVITFNFRNNLTWTDNVPVTANDYNYSLYAWNIAGSNGADTPLTGSLSSASGLIADHVVSPTEIQIYIGSDSIWNLASVNVGVLPQHILGNFNITGIATTSGLALDLTQPSTSTSGQAASSPFCGLTAACMHSDPTWMQYLPNLEVGAGPFYLYTYTLASGGELLANPNYQRAPWAAIAALPANTVTAGTPVSFATTIQEFTYNPGTSAFAVTGDTPLASGSTGYVGINNATATVQVYTSAGVAVGTPITLTATGTNGAYTASIPTTGLSAGAYEVVVTGTYNFLGLARVWYQASGFTVG